MPRSVTLKPCSRQDVDYAKSAFKQTRSLYGKEDGVQAHTVIQSFKPNEVTPEQCNQLGLELAEKIAPNHQVAVYTRINSYLMIGCYLFG